MVRNRQEKSSLGKLLHVGIVVRNMDEAVKRLESLGIGPFKHPSFFLGPLVGGQELFRGKPMAATYNVLLARVGQIEFELFEPGKEDTPWKEFLESKGEGIHHISFHVDDLDKEIAKFAKQGLSVLLAGKLENGGESVYMDLGVGDIILELSNRY